MHAFQRRLIRTQIGTKLSWQTVRTKAVLTILEILESPVQADDEDDDDDDYPQLDEDFAVETTALVQQNETWISSNVV